MARVRCDLPNASENISGVAFMPAVDGSHVLSEEIADEVAARFCSIPGYSLVEESFDETAVAKTHGKRATKAAATTEEVEK